MTSPNVQVALPCELGDFVPMFFKLRTLSVTFRSLFDTLASALFKVNTPSSRLESMRCGVGVAQVCCSTHNKLNQNILSELFAWKATLVKFAIEKINNLCIWSADLPALSNLPPAGSNRLVSRFEVKKRQPRIETSLLGKCKGIVYLCSLRVNELIVASSPYSSSNSSQMIVAILGRREETRETG